jgi:hypothetical protein
MHKSIPVFVPCLLLLSCTVRPPLTADMAAVAAASVAAAAESVSSMRGGGDIDISGGGEELTARFDIVWNGDSSFLVQIYGPLGMPLASIKSVTAARWLVIAGDSQYTQHPSQRINVGNGFLELPFTWNELLSALTLRYPCAELLRSRPDSVFTDRKGGYAQWRARRCNGLSADIYAVVDNKKDRLSEITYISDEKERGTLIFRKFNAGYAKEIRFVPVNNNYFYVTYHALTVNSRKVGVP